MKKGLLIGLIFTFTFVLTGGILFLTFENRNTSVKDNRDVEAATTVNQVLFDLNDGSPINYFDPYYVNSVIEFEDANLRKPLIRNQTLSSITYKVIGKNNNVLSEWKDTSSYGSNNTLTGSFSLSGWTSSDTLRFGIYGLLYYNGATSNKEISISAQSFLGRGVNTIYYSVYCATGYSGGPRNATMSGFQLTTSSTTSTSLPYARTLKESDTLQQFSGNFGNTTYNLPLQNPTRTGHTFIGWYNGPDGGVKSSGDEGVSASLTYKAHWDNYILRAYSSFDSTMLGTNGWINDSSNYIAYKEVPMNTAYGTLPTPTRRAYTFKGWYTSSSGGNQVTSSTVISSDANIYAQWTPSTYTITFNPNGGSLYSSVNSSKRCYNIEASSSITNAAYSVINTLPTPSRNGYTFYGWSPTASLSHNWGNSEYSSGTSVKNKYGNVTFTAQWNPLSYILDINGNLDGMQSDTLENYATFDVIVDNVYMARDVNEYRGSVPYGSTYEITNINFSTDKELVGTYYDNACTISGSLSGTIPAGDRVICLKIRTKTWEDYASTSYASGSGTEESPYIIKTPQQLAKLAKDSRSSNLQNLHYKLGAPIDLSAHVWSGIGVVGNYTKRFVGHFDGGHFAISNISTSKDYLVPTGGGLFSYTDLAGMSVIENVILINGDVVGSVDAGAITANGATIIRNCIVDGVNVTAQNAGGIIGVSYYQVTNCVYKNGTVNGSSNAAGIMALYAQELEFHHNSVLNATIVGGNARIIGENASSSYGYGTINGTTTKKMYGNSSAWENWAWGNYINDGYPVQYPLYAVAQFGDSQGVYDRLVALGFTQG